MTRKNILRKTKTGLLLTAAALMIGNLGGCGSSEEPTTVQPASEDSYFSEYSLSVRNKTQQVESLINQYFYFDQDKERREERYFDGIMAGLDDPYSVYYTKEEMKRLEEDDSGEYVGIGASVSKNVETGAIYVVKPLRGSPAEAAGLLPEDVFVEIDGVELTTDMELEEVVKMIRGSKGTTAKLKMYRAGEKDYVYFDIQRAVVQNITVEYELLENGIGYIQVSEFIENTFTQFKEAVDYLEAKGAKALIIDMRSNPGGFTSQATDMVDYLLKDNSVAEGENRDKPGILLEMKDKNGKVIQSDKCSDDHYVDLPMAVLVNENTASSSEIFSGAMQDYKKATLVGMKTYGKGIVQQVFGLTDGSGVKLTIASYFLPSGRNIHKDGLVPDVEIDMDIELRRQLNLPHYKDVQLQKAVEVLGGEALKEP